MRFSSSVWTCGASEKRTDLGEGAAALPDGARRDFLNEEDAVRLGRWEARAKSSFSEGSFGWVMVEDVVSVGVPRNCDVRSLYWV